VLYLPAVDAFSVLAEPHRRQVVEILARRGKLTASQISDEFDVTPQAVSQHLRVLREANVIQMERSAQRRFYALNPRSMDQIQVWTSQMARLWRGRLDRLEKALKEEDP
jgi:DNA-binding transcriptional ArsR family regulator